MQLRSSFRPCHVSSPARVSSRLHHLSSPAHVSPWPHRNETIPLLRALSSEDLEQIAGIVNRSIAGKQNKTGKLATQQSVDILTVAVGRMIEDVLRFDHLIGSELDCMYG